MMKRYATAEQLLRRSTTLPPDEKQPWVELGSLYLDMHDYGQAERTLSAALERAPDDGSALAYRSMAREELGRLDDALADAAQSCDIGSPIGCDQAAHLRRRIADDLAAAAARKSASAQ